MTVAKNVPDGIWTFGDEVIRRFLNSSLPLSVVVKPGGLTP